MSRSISLGQLFAGAATLGVALLAAAAVWFLSDARAAALAASERSRRAVATGVEARVAAALGEAAEVLDRAERALDAGLVRAGDRRALGALLDTELTGNPRLAEVTFTGARPLASDGERGDRSPDAELPLEPEGRFQLSAFTTRQRQHVLALTERDGTERDGRSYVERRVAHTPGEPWPDTGAAPSRPALDPTSHPTFGAALHGDGPVYSDLHFSDLDQGAPEPRVVLTVQKAVSAPGMFGVIRVGWLTTGLDAVTQRSLQRESEQDPHLVALLAVAATEGAPARLVTRVAPDDTLRSIDGELRVFPRAPPPALGALLASPLVYGLDPECPQREGTLDVAGERWLVTLSPLSIADAGTRGWAVAVLVPQRFYTRELDALGRALIAPSMLAVLAVAAVLSSVLVALRHGLRQVERRSARMRALEFDADGSRSAITDVDVVLAGVERAKTAARAMCRYIPVPLVRRLYERNQEPALGGEPCDLTLLFTDIQGFTSLAERLPPDELAHRLGQYLSVVTDVLESHGATIDKYIGDAVMAFWNAPAPITDHPVRACQAVLGCRRALAALFASPAWDGLPPLITRFGVHAGRALVGHFGAPSRLSYTALGDAVNLAARLESACKQYGVQALVSAEVARAAGGLLDFRWVDRLVARGKTEAVDVYELIGPELEQRASAGVT